MLFSIFYWKTPPSDHMTLQTFFFFLKKTSKSTQGSLPLVRFKVIKAKS
jgi:hypothetical protein